MVIGITGTNGAGKGTVVDYLVTKGFTQYSVRSFLIEEIKRRGLSIDRSSMRDVANDLRKMHEPSYIIKELFKKATEKGGNAVLESVRNLGEAEFLKKNGALLLAVDANRKIRYERIVKRGSETDKIDYETWVAQEEREWNNTEAHDMDVPGVMRMADHMIRNDGTVENLHQEIDSLLAKITK